MQKEDYLTSVNSEKKVREWQRELAAIKRHNPLSFQPSKSALLVLDMQNVFLDVKSHAYIPSSPLIIKNINQLIGAYKRQNLPIIFTRHTTKKSQKAPIKPRSPSDPPDMMVKWWRHPILDTDPESKIHPSLNLEGLKVLKKHQYSAFHETKLHDYLQTRNVNQIVISGVMAHLCCESTAREAFMRGYEVFFLIDGTASYSEKFHVGTLRAIAHGFGKCVSCSEVINLVEKEGGK